MSVGSVTASPFQSWYWCFIFFSLNCLREKRNYWYFINVFKEPSYDLVPISNGCLLSVSPVSALIFVIPSFHFLGVQFAVPFPPSWYGSLTHLFSTFLIYAFRTIDFPLRSALAATHHPRNFSSILEINSIHSSHFSMPCKLGLTPQILFCRQNAPSLTNSRMSRAGFLKEPEEGQCGSKSKSEWGMNRQGRQGTDSLGLLM